jgi:MraZ protein
MSGFSGTHQNRIDAKGRVSIPAPFRAILRAPATEGACATMLRPSYSLDCIEAWTHAGFEAMAAALDQFPTFSQEQEDMAFAVHADAHAVESDKEGRIIIPERLSQHAKLGADIVFVGVGKIFQIWDPAALELRRAAVQESLRARRIAIPLPPTLGVVR